MKRYLVSSLLLFFPLSFVYAKSTVYPVTLDNCGNPLTIERQPSRAVIHDINMSQMVFSLGLQKDIVGVTGISGWYKMLSSFKKNLGDIPELAPKYPSLEILISSKADFFFSGWNYGMKVGGDVTPQTLKPYNIDTLVLSESCIHTQNLQKAASMDLLYSDIKKLGVIFDVQDQADQLIADWKARIAKITERKKINSTPPLKVFLYDSGEDKPFTAGKYAMPNAIIEAAGGVNVTGDMPTGWASTSWEFVARSNPDVIILLDYQTANGANALKNFLERHPLMKHTKGVMSERYLTLRYEQITPGPENIKAIEKLADVLMPNYF